MPPSLTIDIAGLATRETAMTSPKKRRTAQCLATEDAAKETDSSDQLSAKVTLPLLAGFFCWLRLNNRMAWGRYDSTIGPTKWPESRRVESVVVVPSWCCLLFARDNKAFLFYTHVIKSKHLRSSKSIHQHFTPDRRPQLIYPYCLNQFG